MSTFANAFLLVAMHVLISRVFYYRAASRLIPRLPMKALCVVLYALGAIAQLPGISALIAALSHVHYLDTTFMDHPDMHLVMVHHAVLLFHCDCVALSSPTLETTPFNRLGFLGMAVVHSGILAARLLHRSRRIAFAIRCITPTVGLGFNCVQLWSLRGAPLGEPHAVALSIVVLELLLLRGEVRRKAGAVTPGITSSAACARSKGMFVSTDGSGGGGGGKKAKYFCVHPSPFPDERAHTARYEGSE